jgi:hypothetical protein
VLHVLIGTQLLLGGAGWWSRIYAASFPQPIPVMVSLTVIHTVMGALVLASTVLLTLACYRIVPLPDAQELAGSELRSAFPPTARGAMRSDRG